MGKIKLVVGKYEGRKPLMRLRKRKDNIKMDPRKIRYRTMSWIHLTHVRNQWRPLVNTIVYLLFHKRR
jgi:hypothetical protein